MARSTHHHGLAGRRGDAPVRITTAPASVAEERHGRERRYLISMAVRIVCFVAAVFLADGWLRWSLVVAAVILPWVAVVMANAREGRAGDTDLQTGLGAHRELGQDPKWYL